jgi:hypothetical protein
MQQGWKPRWSNAQRSASKLWHRYRSQTFRLP